MAAVLGIGPFLPIVALGGAAAWMSSSSSPMDKNQNADDENRKRNQMIELEHNGANASVWNTKHNKFFLKGSTFSNVIDLDHTPDRKNLNVDPFQKLFQQHVDLEDFDRNDTLYSLMAGQGEIRMSRRMPIVATLSRDLAAPFDPSRVTNFEAYQAVPNWANEAQIAAVKRQLDTAGGYTSVMRYYDGEFFYRAPGQSFRYEGN